MKDSQKSPKKKRLFKGINKSPSRKSFAKNQLFGKSSKVKKESKAVPKQAVLRGNGLLATIYKYETGIVLFLIPLILLIALYIIYVFNSAVSQNIQKNKLIASTDTSFAKYPIVINSYQPILSSKAAILIDANSQAILFSKNPNLRFSMASTAKIMTALASFDYFQPESILTVQSGRVEGSEINLQIGDKFYFRDLLYAMLLPSANDAAQAIADNYPGGKEEFVLKMNEKGQALHLTDTHFSDPVGIDDDGNYTTVVDLARLSSVAIKNKMFAEIVATKQKNISNIDNTRPYTLSNLNKLLGINGVNGIKTGTTEGAGEVLVTSALIENNTFIIVVMNSRDRFTDTSALLNFAANNVQFIDPGLQTED